MLLCAAYVASAHSVKAADGPPGVEQVSRRVQAIEKIVTNRCANEKHLQDALDDLIGMFELLKKMSPTGGTEKAPDDPVIRVQSDIVRLVSTINARLPDEEPAVGGGRRSPLPVPSYNKRKLVGQAAEKLQAAQGRLAAAVRESPDSEASRDALIDTIVAQEELAWEVGWPHTPDEVETLKESEELTSEVYLKRRDRGQERINQHLKRETEGAGRVASRLFAILRPVSEEEQKRVEKRLAEQRGAAAADWMKGTSPMDEKELRKLLAQR